MNELGMLIVICRRHVWNTATRRLEASGYSMPFWALLGCLTKFGPVTQRDIAAAIGQHPAGVSRMIDEMEEHGLVRRRRDTADRRRARVEMTRSGKAMFKAAEPLVQSSMKDALRGLSAAEQRELARLLVKMVAVDTTSDIVRDVLGGGRPKRAAPSRPKASPGRKGASKLDKDLAD